MFTVLFIAAGIVTIPILYNKVSSWFSFSATSKENSSSEAVISPDKEESEQITPQSNEQLDADLPAPTGITTGNAQLENIDIINNPKEEETPNEERQILPVANQPDADSPSTSVGELIDDADVDGIYGDEVDNNLSVVFVEDRLSVLQQPFPREFEKADAGELLQSERYNMIELIGQYKGQVFKYFPEKGVITTDTKLGKELYQKELLSQALITPTANGKFIFITKENGVVKALPGQSVKDLIVFHEGIAEVHNSMQHYELIGVQAQLECEAVLL